MIMEIFATLIFIISDLYSFELCINFFYLECYHARDSQFRIILHSYNMRRCQVLFFL